MKKIELKKLFLTILIIFSISLLFSCTPGNPPIDSGDITINNKIKDVVKVKSVDSVDYYKIIFENGIEKDFTVINGKDGISVVKSEINEEGELVLTYSNGNTINLGKVVGTNGENGTDGKDGVGIEEVKIDENYNLLITLTTGTTLNLGNIRGEQGLNGISVVEAKITEDGSLILKLSNNQEINVGNIMGKDGINGVGIKAIEFNQSGELIITLTDNNTINCGKIPTCKHIYGEYTILLEASCKQIGVKVRTCQLCEHEDLEFIELTDHTFIDSVVQSTCEKEGCTLHKCDVCGYSYEDTFTEKLDHQLKEVYYIVDTCTHKEILCICEKCGIAKIITKNDNFHNYQDTITYPTCTTKGYTTHICNICNDTYIDTYVNELQHDLIHVPVKEPTCTTDGYYAYDECQRDNCDYTTYIKIEKIGHNFVDGICTICGENNHSEGLVYFLNSDETSYGLTGLGKCKDTDIVIANIYNGLPVTSIRDYAFSSCDNIISVEIPNSVASIGESAFYNCSNLTSITIPNSVTSIGYYAFSSCSSLTSITIPNSVTSIGERAFDSCSSLTNVYYSGTIEDWCNIIFSSFLSNPMGYAQHFYMLDENKEYKEVTEIEMPNIITKIGNYQFCGLNNVTSITIPNSVTSIGKYAFDGCSSLTSITIPNSVTNIGYDAFGGCSSLTSITIPNSVTSIGSSAFYNCSNLTSITIPNSVTSIGENAFSSCDDLLNVYYSGTIEDWCNITFSYYYSNPMSNAQHFYMLDENNEYKEVTEIEIPNTITKIGNYQFLGFNNVTSITIPNSITSIGKSAFYSCDDLLNVYYSGTIEDWCNITFSNYDLNLMYYAQHFYMLDENKEYKEVTEIKIPNTITEIGNYQFYGFNNVTSIIIPNSVTSIGFSAFECCGSLTNIVIPNSVTSIGEHAFSGCNSLTSITIPNSITSIGKSAFSFCSSLTSITIPNSVTSIGESVFNGCYNLTSLIIPNSVTSIGSNAFNGCHSLTIYCETISKPSKWSSKFNIDDRPVYWGVTKEDIIEQNGIQYLIIDENATITRYVGNNASLDIPKTITVNGTTYNVTSIGESAFRNCKNLINITISNSVISIGKYAFRNCSNLTIYCEVISKPSEWDNYWNYSNQPVYWGYTKE